MYILILTCYKLIIQITGNLTVLHICAENGLKKGVDAILNTPTGLKCCQVQTSEGYFPIDLAAMSSEKEIIQMLLPYADTETKVKDVNQIIEEGQIKLKHWHLKNEQGNSNTNTDNKSKDNIDISKLFASLKPAVSEEQKLKAEELKGQGNDAYKSKKYYDAIDWYTKSIELNGTNATVWSNRSACYLALNKPDEALIDAEICRRLDPVWSKGCYRLACARMALHQYEDAAVAAFEGCKLDESNKELKTLMQDAVKKGREEHVRITQQSEQESIKNKDINLIQGNLSHTSS